MLNGGFETGDFTDWTVGGTAASTVETSTVYSGTYAAQLGSASVSGTPTDSSIVETLTIPSNANSLSFAYQLVNPNPDPNNYLEVWVRDTASDKLYRLFDTSTNGAGWQNQVLTYLQK